jgi:hypothetical protein
MLGKVCDSRRKSGGKEIFEALDSGETFGKLFQPDTSILQMAPNYRGHVLGSGLLSVTSYSDFRGDRETEKLITFWIPTPQKLRAKDMETSDQVV